MSLIAGLFGLNGPVPVFEARSAELRRKLSRESSDRVTSAGDAHAFFAKVDIGAFGSPAEVDDATGITMVAGEPLLASTTSGDRARLHDVRRLHHALAGGDYSILRRARGTFACAHLSREDRRLILATDKAGIRPMYFYMSDELVVFSSTLRLLESLSFVPRRADLRGIAEQVAFGFAFGARTPYEGIALLRPGELLSWDFSGPKSQEYWRWQDIPPSADDIDTLADRAHDAFIGAVRARQGTDRYATAFLSGGLDSRCVVAALRADGVRVHSFNFARANSEDRVYGAALAHVAGTVHEESDMADQLDVRWSSMIAEARSASTAQIKNLVERPQLIWSGDGGSVGMGHVYIRPSIEALCRQENLKGAAAAYVEAERAVLPKRLLASQAAATMLEAPFVAVVEELMRLRGPSLLQSFYLMLMHNDQHRHLFRHFEDIDLHRVELQLPFFDGEFLEVVVSVPIEKRLYHRFYSHWLKRFPTYVSATYWQAYPGHEPCPIPRMDSLEYQWDPQVTRAKRRNARRRSVRAGLRTALARNFAADIMRRSTLMLATLIQVTGIREMDHIIDAARSIQAYRDQDRTNAS